MEKSLIRLKEILNNLKKSPRRTYSGKTINLKLQEIKIITEQFEIAQLEEKDEKRIAALKLEVNNIVKKIKEYLKPITMPQTTIEFLNTASKLITDFDGKSENLRSFLDSLSLVDSIKETHESILINLIKTKLKGNARNLINDESTVTQIIEKLKANVKCESVEVLTAKIMNIKQNNKTANAYCSEIETLTKALENTYISDGLSCELASKYSTQAAVKAMTANCTLDRV